MEWEKIFANNMTDKGLMSKIYKQLLQFSNRKTKNAIKEMGRRPKQTFIQRRYSATYVRIINQDHVGFTPRMQELLSICKSMSLTN